MRDGRLEEVLDARNGKWLFPRISPFLLWGWTSCHCPVFLNFISDCNSSDKNNIEISSNKCWRLSPKNKYSISYVELFIVRWRTWGHLGAASLFLLHVAYTSVILYWRTGEKKNKVVSCRERETSCHKRLNWARLARQISQPTVCFRSVTSFVAPHRGLERHLVPLCCTAGLLLAS